MPAELTSFVGRRRELSEIRGLLPAARLLTLTAAMSTLVPISNVTWICTMPFEAEFELM